jgi:hypothetical protein
MADSDILSILAVIGVAIWAAYGTGKNVGASQERKAQELYRRAERETDPETKTKLLREWNELTNNNKRVKKAFREALLLGKHKNDRS